jgi:hypothetical protein
MLRFRAAEATTSGGHGAVSSRDMKRFMQTLRRRSSLLEAFAIAYGFRYGVAARARVVLSAPPAVDGGGSAVAHETVPAASTSIVAGTNTPRRLVMQPLPRAS